MIGSLSPIDCKTELHNSYRGHRRATMALTEGLSAEDMGLQSMSDASPGKWHLAHTTWFFEEFVLKPFHSGYRPFDAAFGHLFNSYYEGLGRPFPRPERGLLSRPSLERVLQYRDMVDAAVCDLLAAGPKAEVAERVNMGLHHEMQHQELLLTDILHAFSRNPLLPALRPQAAVREEYGRRQDASSATSQSPLRFRRFKGGLCTVGADGDGFSFDCEGPRHAVWLQPFELAERCVTNGEWLDFIGDGGYRRANWWLSDGWARCQAETWQHPLYWQQREGHWQQFTLSGLQPLDLSAPVCHVSYFEADAYARWAGARLPREAEWEVATAAQGSDGIRGNLAETGCWQPLAARCIDDQASLCQLYGDVWEWTQSAYAAYPGFRVSAGAVGEYNGKFMCGQFVLRGGSCVTPHTQLRPSYRNFFYPHQRWQFSGLRLARDVG